MRRALAVLAGAALAGLGALIVGEYELRGVTALVAGVVFGLVVGEVVLAVARRREWPLAAAAAVLTAAGLVWALWISSGKDWRYVDATAWVGVGLGALAAGLWIRGPAGPRGRGSPTAP